MSARVIAAVIVALAVITVTVHPRAALPAIVLCALVHGARYTRFAAVLLVVLMLATLAGVRVDAVPHSPSWAQR